ncbi:MAG TPA: type II secretion system F family protein, partial [Desulfobacteraceae bacterium]|nr:type II secretion system F family protein [Desulfobacteraceae bacterium]
MPAFAYKAINEVGKTVSGTLSAESLDQARQNLGKMKLIPMNISRAKKGQAAAAGMSLWERLTSVKPPDLIMFTKQMRTMM